MIRVAGMRLLGLGRVRVLGFQSYFMGFVKKIQLDYLPLLGLPRGFSRGSTGKVGKKWGGGGVRKI